MRAPGHKYGDARAVTHVRNAHAVPDKNPSSDRQIADPAIVDHVMNVRVINAANDLPWRLAR